MIALKTGLTVKTESTESGNVMYGLYLVVLRKALNEPEAVVVGSLKQVREYAEKQGWLWKRLHKPFGGYYSDPNSRDCYKIKQLAKRESVGGGNER
jgi:hypothetical protein